MCGIFGIWRRRASAAPITAADLSGMTRALLARGGDGVALHCSDDIGLGLTRLAIVGANEPAQVFWDASRRYVAVMNGEIFNHAALRSGLDVSSACDTAVVPHLLARDGTSFVEQLIGEYAIAAYDTHERRLILARDRLGVRPLYIAVSDDYVVFASEQRALLATGRVPFELNDDAAQRALVRGQLEDGLPLVRGIGVVPPASLLIAHGDVLEDYAYWKPTHRWSGVDDLAELLQDAVRLRVRSEVGCAAAISGGLDSTVVAELAGTDITHCYTLAVPDRDESALAAATAARLGLTHHIVTPTPPTLETLAATLSMLEYPDARLGLGTAAVVGQLAESVRQDGFRVAIGGEGADEVFLGYPWHRVIAAAENGWPSERDAEVAALLMRVNGSPSALDGWLRIFDGSSWAHAEALARGLFGCCPELESVPSGARARQHMSLRADMLAGPVRIADRMWMQHGVELRTPFLDHRVVEVALDVPEDLLESADEDKPVLRAAAAALNPERPAAPPKRGLQAWPEPSNAQLVAWARDAFGADALFAGADARRLMNDVELGSADAHHTLWHLLVLELTAQGLRNAARG